MTGGYKTTVRGTCPRKMLEAVHRVSAAEVPMVLCMTTASFWITACMSPQWYKMDTAEFTKITVGISYKWNTE